VGNRACIQAGLPATVDRVTRDLETILQQLRSDGYRGKIVMVNYHSPVTYSDPEAADFQAIDAGMGVAAASNGVSVADVFTAFKNASPNGDPCAAGLLIVDANGSCEVHPSDKGRALIANLIVQLASS
jgi:lysophospholipase L1-like esterase